MKKIIQLTIIILTILSTAACSLQDISKEKNDGQTNPINNNIENEKDDLFAQKIKCSNKLNDIQQIIKENDNGGQEEILEEIFYSPSLNTCIYTSSLSLSTGEKNYIISYDIYDALTLQNLHSFQTSDYEKNYMGDDMAYLKAINKIRNDVLKRKVEELKQ